jgi:hypothetical protein
MGEPDICFASSSREVHARTVPTGKRAILPHHIRRYERD